MRSCQCDKDGQNACACFVQPWRRQRGLRGGGARTMAVAAVVLFPGLVLADVQAVTQVGGPPNLPIPTFQETGLPPFTMPVGKPSVLPPADLGTGGGGGRNGRDGRRHHSRRDIGFPFLGRAGCSERDDHGSESDRYRGHLCD